MRQAEPLSCGSHLLSACSKWPMIFKIENPADPLEVLIKLINEAVLCFYLGNFLMDPEGTKASSQSTSKLFRWNGVTGPWLNGVFWA